MFKKDLMIVPAYLGKILLQIHTSINQVMKNKLPYCNFQIFLHSKIKFVFSYVLALLINLSVVAGKRVKGGNGFAIKYHLSCNHSSGLTIFPY